MKTILLALSVLLSLPTLASAATAATTAKPRARRCMTELSKIHSRGVRRTHRLEKKWRELAAKGQSDQARDFIEAAMRDGFHLYSWTYSNPASWYLLYPDAPNTQLTIWDPGEGSDQSWLPVLHEIGRDQESEMRFEAPEYDRPCARIRWGLFEQNNDT